MTLQLDANVWGPHYWFFLMTIAISYPTKANEVTRKKYYDLINNFPLFIPVPKMGNSFSKYLDKYPVTPYLETRSSFMKWVHFIHNKINLDLGKDEVTFTDALNSYYDLYKPKEIVLREEIKYRKNLLFAVILVALLLLSYYLHAR